MLYAFIYPPVRRVTLKAPPSRLGFEQCFLGHDKAIENTFRISIGLTLYRPCSSFCRRNDLAGLLLGSGDNLPSLAIRLGLSGRVEQIADGRSTY